MKYITLQKEQSIAYLTINRPDTLNSFNFDTLQEMGAVVEKLHTDSEVGAVIITGAGEKAFSAGADLKERKNLGGNEVRRNVKKIQDVFNEIARLPQPTIAAINGVALGGGFELALACDFKIAVESSLLGLTEVSWGIIPGAGGTQRLTRLIGEMKAKELILTAGKITAEQAYDLGILTSVTSRQELMNSCKTLAAEILKNAPVAVRQAKYAIGHGCGTDLQTGLFIEAKAYEVTITTEDRLEALKAFSENRKPEFKGK